MNGGAPVGGNSGSGANADKRPNEQLTSWFVRSGWSKGELARQVNRRARQLGANHISTDTSRVRRWLDGEQPRERFVDPLECLRLHLQQGEVDVILQACLGAVRLVTGSLRGRLAPSRADITHLLLHPGDNIGVEYAPVVFAIAESPKEAGVIWAGTSDGLVQITRDGGKNWTQLREGLPQEQAYDVVLRHALDFADDCLAFGSTTGNLYVSQDRGRSWETAANNLPPIYSVRFG